MLWLSLALLSSTGWEYYSCFLYPLTYITLHTLDIQVLPSTNHRWLLLFKDQISVPLGFFRRFGVQSGRCSHPVEDENVIQEELYDLVGWNK